MNRGRGISADMSDAASSRAYSHLQQMGRQCTGSPRAYSGAARSRILSGQSAHLAEPWPIFCAEQEDRKRSATCCRTGDGRAASSSSPARMPSGRPRQPELRVSEHSRS